MASQEYGKCDMCGEEGVLQRAYYHYDVKCDCHSPTHFELIKYCKDCVPSEPVSTCVHRNGGFMWYGTKELKLLVENNKKFISDVVFSKVKEK